MNLLREKQKLMPYGNPMMDGGGGGGGSGGTTVTDLPDWAKGYAQETLGKASALTDINQNPYQTYTKERVAGFQPLQQQAMQTAASPEAFGREVQGYMSPYMQNVVDIQKREAMRGAGILGAQQQARATGAGAFGGYREGIERSERDRNLMTQLGDIQAAGSQRAFEQGTQQARTAQELQMRYGGQQQQLEQQRLSQQYQDFLNQERHPYQQLEFMSNLIRGTPMGTVQTMYNAPGSTLGQLGGLGLGVYGMSQAMKAEGGQIKEYADGGSVTSDYKVDSILSTLSDVQLQQARAAAINSRDRRRLEMIDDELAERASLRSGLGGAFNTLPEETQESMIEMATGGIVAFDDGGSVEKYSDGGTMSGFFSAPEEMAMDELRRQKELSRLAEEEKYNAMVEGRTPTPAPVARKAEPAKPASPPVAAPAPAAKKEARVTSTPNITRQNATEAVSTLAAAAKIEIPKDETQKLAREMFAELNAKSEPDRLEFKKELESAKNRAKEIEARGIGEALMKFGFGMAASAAKPGVARRSGLAGALESAASASPILAESLAENAKMKQAAQDNYMKLRMDNAKYQSALEQGNMQLAATMANNISQRQLMQTDLQQKIAQGDRMFGLEKEKLGIMRAQAGQGTTIQKIASDLQSADPKLGREAALEKASRIAGYSFKGEAAAGGKLQAALSKIDDDYKMLPALLAGNPDSKLTQQMVAERQNRRNEAYRLYGGQQEPGAVTSDQSPGAGAGQMKLVGVR